MKKLLLASCATLALSATSFAADLPGRAPAMAPAPAFVAMNWSGFYLGINGGYAWSVDSRMLSFTNVGVFNGVAPSGGFGGGQIGYNWQGSSPLVLGVEADLQASAISDSGISTGGRVTHYNLDWFGTVRGRIGYAFDQALVYATGGVAFGGLKKRTTGGVPTDYAYNDTAVGYALGAGIEYKFNPAWSLKLEYQYINLGKHDMRDPAGVVYATTRDLNNAADAFHTVRVGLNYMFGGPAGPVVAKY